ncbi:arginyl aminopeptidase [Chryseotalea sanaruensis]|uniref:Arginyl aminopeptidase n=1 Tax=Chryseotalea sanaruensis TaxID=2482724 RepID=A0A401UBD5_9BACT|nr:M28 family peptidase [Chryseotalea sanaruensis]GCC52164.1 arginyl aminopeptidase [Chryseotalea sanaruensis]
MKRTYLLGLGLILSLGLQAQDPVAQKYGALITTVDLKENLTILASDAMEGRETGKRGQKMAAAFISAHFEELGLVAPVNGGYQQPVELYTTGAPKIMVKSQAGELKEFEDYTYYGSGESKGIETLDLVFAGKGSEEDLKGLDIKGKAVAILLDANASLRSNTTITSLREKGVTLVVAFSDKQEEFNQLSGMLKRFSSGRLSISNKASANMGMFIASPATSEKLFKTSADKLKKAIADKKVAKVKPSSISFSIAQTFNPLKTSNVLGYLEGTDKKDEIVVITSHYDHIGMLPSGDGDRINNGADDDGSGTVAVMQLAKAFTEAKKDGKGPRRSILFMTVTGEEKGLLGSDYYTKNPIYPLANTVVNLNIDMIGRSDPQHKDSAPYVYMIGSDRLSTELHNLSESTNKTYTKLAFDYTYNAEDHPDRIYYRSDHWNFAKNNIPIIFYFDGIHEDYHKPSDEVDKIEFDLLKQRAELVFYTAWEIANRDNRLVVDKK